MRFVVKTQVLAILMGLFWIIYLSILAFFDQPGRALQYINVLVYGFAILFAVMYFLMTKVLIGRNWLAVPLVLIPYFLVYKPFFQRILTKAANSYEGIINFLALSTGATHFLAIIFGLGLGIMFTRPKLQS
ncbi:MULTISPECIES: hypothetical protein [Bacillaceae]|uniref:hypothetical protein n=1 Tax=Bacillaceae TaxID=186817 RepID=UPI001187F00D|nr:hypothetical protein [Bacillus sp. S3]QCJ42433.1 hypothetical protein FAY30_11205 [Bacillus sp. S3]